MMRLSLTAVLAGAWLAIMAVIYSMADAMPHTSPAVVAVSVGLGLAFTGVVVGGLCLVWDKD